MATLPQSTPVSVVAGVVLICGHNPRRQSGAIQERGVLCDNNAPQAFRVQSAEVLTVYRGVGTNEDIVVQLHTQVPTPI